MNRFIIMKNQYQSTKLFFVKKLHTLLPKHHTAVINWWYCTLALYMLYVLLQPFNLLIASMIGRLGLCANTIWCILLGHKLLVNFDNLDSK